MGKNDCQRDQCNPPSKPIAEAHVERFSLQNFKLSFQHGRRKNWQSLDHFSFSIDETGDAGIGHAQQAAPGFDGAPLRKARMLPRRHRPPIPGIIGQVDQQVRFLFTNKASRQFRHQVFVTNQRRDFFSAGQVQCARAVARGKPFHKRHAGQ